jgi:hypothetical protein
VPFSQGVALGYLILPLQGKCRHTARISRSLSLTARKKPSLTHPALKDVFSFREIPWQIFRFCLVLIP